MSALIDRLLDLPAILFAVVIVFGSLGLISACAWVEWVVLSSI